MFRKIACAAVVMTVSLGLAVAEPVKGRITSIEGKKVTIMVGAKKGEPGEKKVYDLAAAVKVQKGVGKDKTEALADGLKATELQNIDAKKGVSALLEVKDNTISEITIFVKKK